LIFLASPGAAAAAADDDDEMMIGETVKKTDMSDLGTNPPADFECYKIIESKPKKKRHRI
jgi:hypothetical protein